MAPLLPNAIPCVKHKKRNRANAAESAIF